LKKKRVCIAIPASVVSDTPHLREKTSKIGLIGRAAAIFRVDEIIIYRDDSAVDQSAEMDLIFTLLAYMETPQYLRKRLFKLQPALRYAGVLPPLRTRHHPLNRKMKGLKVGEYREGVSLSQTREGTLVDIGVEAPALVSNKQLTMGKRVTVKVTRVGRQIEAELASRDEISGYWGYTVTVEKRPLGSILKRGSFDLAVATSKYGVSFVGVSREIREKWEKAETVITVFGAPSHGLKEILKRERLKLDDVVDFVVNTIPLQGTETVRTEEALIASLAALNLSIADVKS
jgi:predicted SPOUT superfamily RNA methylase MTH1